MSDKERAEQRAEQMQDEAGSSTEREEPDVEAHRHEVSRADLGTEPEDRDRADLGV